MSKNFLILAFIALSSLFIYSGCTEKGCNDRNALNYDPVSNVNDGSCTYCDTPKVVHTGPVSNIFLVETNFSSQLYGDTIIEFVLDQYNKNYVDTKCGENDCSIEMRLYNFKNNTVTFSYTVDNNNGMRFTSNGTSLIIPPYGTLHLKNIEQSSSFGDICSSIKLKKFFASGTIFSYK